MTTEEGRTLLEDFLVAGTEDWSDISFVYSMCMDEGETDPEKLRERALELISEVLLSGLMVAGDVDKKFVPWELSAEDSFARIKDEWMATTPRIYPFDIAWLDLTPAGEERASEVLAREAFDDTGLLLESIRAFLDGRTSAADFARSFEHLESTNGIREPAPLRRAFEELANVATCFWEEHLSGGPPPTHVAERGLRSAAQSTYDTAVEIIRQRGLHNTC